jgi:septal ring factor EnvC (AmiA/AmiB activator)
MIAVKSWRLIVGSRTKCNRALAHFLPFAFCLLLFTIPAYSQTSVQKNKKEQLQLQMKKLQEEIKQIEEAIKTTSAKKEKNMGEILSLQAKIRSREKLINNINDQIGDLDATINETGEEINTKSAEVEKMKQDYANMLRKSYENITLRNQLIFLLSSNSVSEAYRRYNYLLKIAEYRRNQAKVLQQSIGELQAKKEELELTKEEKLALLQKQSAQKQLLEKEKQNKDAAIAQLQEKEKKLRKQIDEKNQAARKLNDRIRVIIEEEIAAARKKAEEAAKKSGAPAPTTKTTDVMPMTPQEQALSKDFANNRGKLPWPVLRGHVISQFGKHEHPAIKGVMVENNGVDIKTEAGAEARTIFAGTVVSVFSLPTTHYCVIVKHGEYFTVYSNLETVSVKPNQTLTVKQPLGTLHTDKTEDLTKVHIEIWKGKEKMDPELWLAN